MNKIAEDLLPSRETKVLIPPGLKENEEIFAVCLKTDDAELLIPFKIYRIALRGEYARVIDERGETAIYPKNFFLPLQLPIETAAALSLAYTQIS
jgi:hypothetical protein